MQKATSVILLVVALSVGLSVFGAYSATPPSVVEQRLARMGLTVIEEIPAGVKPLELTSVDELRFFLFKRPAGGSITGGTHDSPVGKPVVSTSTTITIRTIHSSYICNPLWRTEFNLWADIYIASWGSYYWIDDVRNVRVGLTGFHPFMRLTNTYTDAYVYPDNQHTRIEGGGTIEYYFFIQGILTYYSEPAWIVYYYRI
jgi:hypothetical protein